MAESVPGTTSNIAPDIDIGSTKRHTQTLWVYETEQMVNRRISYVPGLYKMFDEILVNAADNKQRDPTMDSLEVEIDAVNNLIRVYNNGKGVPFEELKKITVLTNIFSTYFVIETAYGSRPKKYKQVFSNNMGIISDPVITKCKRGENWTRVSFKPDLEKFGMVMLEDDVVALMKKRVIDMAGCLGQSVKVELNGKPVPIKSFQDYVKLFLVPDSESSEAPKSFYHKVDDRWEICVSVSTTEGQFQQVSFVNSIATIKGGTHVDHITNQISNYLVGVVKKKSKNADVHSDSVKNYLWVFVNALIEKPTFDSQTKDTLTLRQSNFRSKCELPKDFLKKVAKSTDIVENLVLLYTLQRSIPCMVDGLKPSERKILFTCFKCNLVKDVNVGLLQAYVCEESAYCGDVDELHTAIVGMAQNFVGSNNVNLLAQKGMFGTRLKGGKDHGGPHYTHTCLSPITRFLFPKDDDRVLKYFAEDGCSVEPSWYAPIIPTILVNGSKGSGTFIPNYNPRDIVANLKRLLNHEKMERMLPWYRGFRGNIKLGAAEENGFSYNVSGIIEEINKTTFRIMELPVGRWTEDYIKWLNSVTEGFRDEKGNLPKDAFVLSFKNYGDDKSVCFEVLVSEEKMREARHVGRLVKKFRLTSTISTSNMRLLDRDGIMKRYESPEKMLKEFFQLRLDLYEQRKKLMISALKREAKMLENKVLFIQKVVGKEINFDDSVEGLVSALLEKGFKPFPKKKSIEETVNSNGVRVSDFDYLLYMPGISFLYEEEELRKLEKEWMKIKNDIAKLKTTSPEDLWLLDLKALEAELDKLDVEEAKKREESDIRIYGEGGFKVTKPAPKQPTRKSKAASGTMEKPSSSSAMETETVPDVVKPKGRARKAPAAEKKPVSVSDSDDEVEALTDRLKSTKDMVTDVPEKPARKGLLKRAAMKTVLSDLSDNEDSDVEVVRKKGGRKPWAAGAKKRTITEMLKPAEDSGIYLRRRK